MNKQIPETDQWKLNGDCKKCRRAEYCRKKCTACKRAEERQIKALGNAIIDSVLPEPFASHAKKWRTY